MRRPLRCNKSDICLSLFSTNVLAELDSIRNVKLHLNSFQFILFQQRTAHLEKLHSENVGWIGRNVTHVNPHVPLHFERYSEEEERRPTRDAALFNYEIRQVMNKDRIGRVLGIKVKQFDDVICINWLN